MTANQARYTAVYFRKHDCVFHFDVCVQNLACIYYTAAIFGVAFAVLFVICTNDAPSYANYVTGAIGLFHKVTFMLVSIVFKKIHSRDRAIYPPWLVCVLFIWCPIVVPRK